MDKVGNLKETILLTPVEMVWLHSHHEFRKIEEGTIKGINEVKFYKNNKGVEIRYQSASFNPDLTVIRDAKESVEDLICGNEIKLLDAELTKELYIKIAKEVRREFGSSYPFFLHYETFENCCKKLKDKFGITSTYQELERLQADNKHFCFLICERDRFDEIWDYTQKLLNTEVSCASTSFTRKVTKVDLGALTFGRKSHSVKSLRGSFTSGGDQLDLRISVNNSESDQEIYDINHTMVQKISKQSIDKICLSGKYVGIGVSVESYKYTHYLEAKRRLYHTNRLQHLNNPHVRRIYSYNITENPVTSEWKLRMVVQRHSVTFREQISKMNSVHYWKKKSILVYKLAKVLASLHESMETQSQLTPDSIYIDQQGRVLLSGTSLKQVPPHTCPFQHDCRLLFCIIFWVFTGVQMTYECILRKLHNEKLLFSMYSNSQKKSLTDVLSLTNSEFNEEISLHRLTSGLKLIIDRD